MNRLLSIALLIGLSLAGGCSSDSGGSGSAPGAGGGAAASGCQALADCCNSGDAAFQSSCNSGLTQANNNDAVCTGVLQDLQKSGKCGGGQGGSGQGGSGQAGSGQAGEGQAGSGQAGSAPTGAECMTLAGCCATLTAGVKDGCDHVVGLNAPASCQSLLGTYQKAGQCLPMAAKAPFSCDTSATDQKCFEEQVDSAALPALMASCPNGTIGTICPSADLVGCCHTATVGVCYYTGGGVPEELEMQCTAASGTWSMMP